MKFLLSCKNLAALTVLIGSVSSLLTPEKLEISAAFPTNNQFGIVFNGQPNKILLKVLNLGKDPVEDVMRIHQVWNEFREIGGKERLLRKGAPVPSKRTLPPKIEPYIIPYMFSAEEREGNIGLRIWVEWSGPKGKKHQSIAYDSTVTIQEPPTRWFDPQLYVVFTMQSVLSFTLSKAFLTELYLRYHNCRILLYIILASTFGGIGYMVYSSYVVPVKPARSLKSKRSAEGSLQSSSKVSTPTGGAYEEEWIPAGHSVRSSKKTGTETGGEESSGAEGKARRRKR
ncbi:hypothetical protein PGTUg99_034127 [Puccinia graminis f. sp. tritici]|uniref:Signal sequence receptor subunit alpha n=1 Tax=Puccinia graminis f. sp. tritici TaxID=56615 RepID=A0A5B0QUQ5_PUCGR|nr:hypothetical protein PGTUg99_034127 [Puccinia graminis f. sp. tritici]